MIRRIAAHDADDRSKELADIVCTGSNDDETINAALTTYPGCP